MTDDHSHQNPEECQTTGGPAARAVAGPVDWLDLDAAACRIRYILLRESPYNVRLLPLAREVFGDHVESPDREWKWVRRECERQGHTVITHCYTWVVPRFDEGADVLDRTVGGASKHRGDSRGGEVESVAWATANAGTFLGGRRTLDTAWEWGELVGELGAKRLGEEAGDCERTRFNSVGRARDSPNRVATAFMGARAANFTDGVVVTATTDPSRFDSIRDGADSLVDDVNQLRRYLDRPPGVTVTEPTQRGVGHAHIALFGVTEADLPSRHELQGYWHETRKRAQQVFLLPIETDESGAWTWEGQPPSDAGGRPPGAYLRKDALALPTVARLDAADVRAVAEAYRGRGDETMNADTADDVDAAVRDETGVDAESVRLAAWYFGTGVKAATRPSRALRDAGGEA